jgi:hypothetical protein
MPYRFLNERHDLDSSFELPKHLQHKPIYAMPYESLESSRKSDVEFISVGFAQWENNTSDLSLKLLRRTESRWSRQAEELPLNRVIDAAIFLSKVLLDEVDGRVEFEKGTFNNQTSGLRLVKEDVSKMQSDVYDRKKKAALMTLSRRLDCLYKTLDGLKKKGGF